ncbi:hypothetical protein EDB87DRAFT_1826710 [Lactarius vividus]|nr:hypothetical protein EDB87DRAFT_1826710 [Lactarius vividus]
MNPSHFFALLAMSTQAMQKISLLPNWSLTVLITTDFVPTGMAASTRSLFGPGPKSYGYQTQVVHVPLPSTLPSMLFLSPPFALTNHRPSSFIPRFHQHESTLCINTGDNDNHAGDHDGNLNDSKATVTTPTTTMRATPMSSPEDRNLSSEGPNDDNSNDNSPDDNCNNDGGGNDNMGQRTH